MKKKNKFSKTKKVITGVLFACLFCFGLGNYAYSNNVHIDSLTYQDSTIRVKIQWDNSWRNVTTTGSTMNYDGVWVFVKYRDACDKASAVPPSIQPSSFNHLWLQGGPDYSDSTMHTVHSSVAFRLGFSRINGTNRVMGVFVYRKNDGYGTFPATGAAQWVTLKWNKAAQGCVGDIWDIRAYAIEMVYIPQGPFRLGSGNPVVNNSTAYTFSSKTTGLLPFVVTAENAAITLNPAGSGVPGDLFITTSTAGPYTIPAHFPKGYDAYWCMKYEITQGQYCDFMNSLERAEQVYAIPTAYNVKYESSLSGTPNFSFTYTNVPCSAPTVRQYIKPEAFTPYLPVWFGCDANTDNVVSPNSPTPPSSQANDGQWTAMNCLGYGTMYSSAYYTEILLKKYLNWAALRPMTEFEYEKICRGQIAQVSSVPLELIWGANGSLTGTRTPSTGVTLNTPNTSSEIPQPTPCPSSPQAGLYIGNTPVANLYSSGPFRVGSTLTSSQWCDRSKTGSSYYGVADMAGNLWEFVWTFGMNGTITGFASTFISRTSNGNGSTITTGVIAGPYGSNMLSEWYPLHATLANGFFYLKGGAWNSADANWQNFVISYRGTYGTTVPDDQNTGGRGVRTDNTIIY